MPKVTVEAEKKFHLSLELTEDEARSFVSWLGPMTGSPEGASWELYDQLTKALRIR